MVTREVYDPPTKAVLRRLVLRYVLPYSFAGCLLIAQLRYHSIVVSSTLGQYSRLLRQITLANVLLLRTKFTMPQKGLVKRKFQDPNRRKRARELDETNGNG